MSSLAIPIIFLIVSLIIDKAKDNKKNNKETVKKVKQKKTEVPKRVYTEYNQRNNHITKQEFSRQQMFEKPPRVIVDKEKEIFSNSLTFDQGKIVNDIIFSEILSKPKSKR